MFTIDAMPGLQAPFRSLYDRSLDAAHAARPLAELLHDNFIPASLRDTPKAVLPYLIARDTFVQRLYAEHAGYWQANGEGVENFTRAEWALALDELGGHSEDSFRRTADRLEQRGDAALAFRVAELGLARYPNSVALLRSRARADHAQSDQLADESVSVHRLLRVVGQSARACFAAIAANSCPRRTSGHRRTPQLRAGLRRSAIRISAGRVCFRVAANGEVPNEKSPSGDGSSPARPGRQIAVAEDISWPEAERLDQGSGPH